MEAEPQSVGTPVQSTDEESLTLIFELTEEKAVFTFECITACGASFLSRKTMNIMTTFTCTYTFDDTSFTVSIDNQNVDTLAQMFWFLGELGFISYLDGNKMFEEYNDVDVMVCSPITGKEEKIAHLLKRAAERANRLTTECKLEDHEFYDLPDKVRVLPVEDGSQNSEWCVMC